LVDTTAPSVSITSDVGTLKAGETASHHFHIQRRPWQQFCVGVQCG
jgi:hypothetical protein